VLFAAGLNLTLRNRTLIRDDCKVYKGVQGANLVSKEVPIYVSEIDIS
jgi:hypothetical protein